MHNGVVSSFQDVRRDLTALLCDDAFYNIMGSTDSEHAAALYMSNLTQHGTKDTWQRTYPLDVMLAAMVQTATQIMELQRARLGAAATPNSLNFCTTDGVKMVAIRFRNHVSEQPPSLYWSEFAGRSLNGKFPGHPDSRDLVNPEATLGDQERIGCHTIIASEPTTYDEDEWHLIGRNCALTVDEHGTETEVPIEYDPDFNFADPEAAGKQE